MRHHMFSLSPYFPGEKFSKKDIKDLSTQTEMYRYSRTTFKNILLLFLSYFQFSNSIS